MPLLFGSYEYQSVLALVSVFQDKGPYGRIVHLQPVEGREGSPVMGQAAPGSLTGEPVPEWSSFPGNPGGLCLGRLILLTDG